MKMMKINLIFLFLLLIWIDSAISRSPVKKARPAANTKKVTLDLSSGNGDVTQMISQAFVSAITEFKSQLQQNLPVTISFFVTPPPNTKQKYVANTEVVLRNLIAQWVQFPMQGYLKTEVRGKDDGTVGNMTITVSILPPVATKETRPPNFGSVNVDLSKPNVDMMRELRQVLAISLHMPSVRDDGDSSNRIKLQIIAPKQTTSTNVHDIVGAVQSVLSSLLPETQFSLKISVSQYPDGSINYIYCIISIDKSPIQRKNSFTYSLDISETIEVLDGEISNILQDLQPEAERIFSENRPVFISLKVKPPPGSNKQTITQIMDSVSSTINRYFSNKVDMKAQIQKNSRKEITSATFDITIEPSNTISINLNVPGGNLADQITREVTNLKDVLKSKKPIAKTTSFTVIIKPPTTADDKTVEKILHAIGSTFSEIFPGNELKIQIKTTKNSQGVPIKITIIITVEQNADVPTKNEKIEHIDLLKPGSDLINEIRTISTNLKNTVNKYNTTPLKLTLDITPPDKSKDEFITETMKTILAVVTEDFPEDKIKCEANAQKTSQGNLINVKIIITIIPSTSLEEPEDHKPPTIDLTTTESDMVTKTMNILPKLSELMKDNQPASIRLKIQPTGNVKNEAVKQMVNTIVSIFSQAYPQNKLEVQVKLTKDSQGNIENITVFITIEPTNKKPDQETTDTDAININLDDPKKKLVDEISVIIPTLKPKIEEKQKQGIPFNINVNIKPPRGATTEYVKKSANTALTIISKLLPGSEVGVTAKITKNGTGKITDIKLIVTIKPKKTNETTPKPDTSREITLDLFRPGKDVTKEISTSLVNIKKQIDPTRQKNKPVDFQLNIKPPSGSDDSFVRKTVNIISTLLPKLYPDDKIALNVNILKNTDQTIKNVRVSITVSPQEPETISTPPTPKNVHKVQLDLSKPGTDITKEITTQLIKAKPEVIKKTPYNQPGILQIDIEPPKDASDEFARKTVNVVTTFISKLFPDKKIVVKVQALKTPDGTITKMILVINIEPPTNRDETTTSTSRTTTTTTDIVTTPLDKNTIKFNIDLSNPNTDLTNEVMMKLPDIKDEVLLKQPKNIPVKIEFDINVPINPSEDFVKKTPKTIEDTLKRFYPDNELEIRVKLLKDRNGTISNMVVVCTIKPATKKVLPFVIGVVTLKPTTENEINSEATTPSVLTTPSEEEPIKVDFDLTKPKSNLVSDILTVIPNIEKEVDNKRPAKKPVNIEFQVKPSKNTNEKTLKKDMKDIMEVLTKKFPNDEVKINTKIHKQNNKIDNVTYFITIEPSSTTDEKEPKESSTTPKDETTTEDTSGTTTKNVLTTPSEEEPIKVDFDLTKPLTNLVSDILTVIPNIEKEVDNKRPAKKPVNIEFQVKPSKNTNEKTLKKDMKDIMEVLTKKFPNEEIKINTKIHKQNNKIDNVTYFITIEPSSTTEEKEPKESSTTPKDETTTEVTSGTTTKNVLTTPSEEEPIKVDFDLTKPSTNLVSDILTVIPNIEKEVDNKRPAKKPVNIEFQVKPSKNTNEKTLKKDMKDIMEVLTKKFPNEEIKINTKIHKQNNKIDNVTYFITIEPSSTTDEKEPKESSTTPKDETTTEVTSGTTTKNVLTTPSEEEPIKVDFDLTKPSTNLVSDILTVIPNIEKEVDNKRPAKKPVNIEFQVKPSKNTNEKTLKKDMKDIMEVLTKKFPNEEIKINTKIHKQYNKIDNVTYFITIEPSSTTDEKEPKESSTTPKDETTTEVTSGTTTKNVLTTPSEEEPIKVDFDLTKPSTNLVSDILTVIPNIEKEVDNKRPAKKPVNIEFQVKPSKNTNEKTLKKDMKDIMEVLTKKFPNEEIKINTKIHKQNNKIDNVTYFITIEPSSTTDEKEPKESSTTPKDETTTEVTSGTTTKNVLTTPSEEEPIKVDFDLTKPSTNLVSDILTVIPNIEKEVDNKRPAKKPVNIEFQVKPSKNTNEKTLKKDMKDIMEVLTKKFPNEEIKINTKIHKQNNKIDNVTYFITIEPSSTTDEKEPKESSTTPKDETTPEVTSGTTTKNVLTTPSEEEPIKVDFDLTKPSTNLVSDILTVIPNIEKEVDNKRPAKKPVNIEFQVKPSKNTNEKTLKKDMKDIMEVLTKKFPNEEIKINTKIHKQNNKIDNVTYFITIEPSSTNDEKEPKESSTTPKDETTTEVTSGTTTKNVLTTPSEEEPIKVDFDLTKPSTNLVSDILTVIPNIEKEVDNKRPAKKPVNIEFQVKPSKNTNEKTLKKDMKDIMEVLTKKFPNEEIKINTKIHKQNNKIDNVTYFITIEPSSTTDEKEPKESSTTPKDETTTEVTSGTTTKNVLTTPSEEEPIKVDFDLTKPSTNLVSDILTVIPNIEKEVDNKRPAKKPVNIEFQVKPSKNTNEKTLKKDMKDIMEVLTKKFPNEEIKINTKIHKQNNKIDNVTYFITIEPSSTTDEKEPKESSTTPKDETTTEVTSGTTTKNVLTTPSEEEPIKVDFDLTKPSTNLVSDILTVIPNIEKEVDNKRPAKKPVNIEFQVKPSENTNEKTLKKDMKDIMEVLTKKFPNEEIKINTKIHKQNNKIDNVTYFITIEPSSTTDEKEPKESSTTPKDETTTEVTSGTTTKNVLTTPFEEEPIKVDFDLTKPSTNLVSDILTVIPNIEKEVDKKRPAKKPLNIEFQVKPSKNTNEKTLKKDMKDIMEVLTKKFPNEEIKINTKIHKQNNKIDNVTYFITIEPSSTTDEKEPKESSTTPKDETTTEVTSETTTQNVLTTPSEEEPIKVDFDLTKPSTNLVSDILTVIPNIEKEVDKKRPAKKPLNIEFQVKPSKNTNEKTLKKDMKDIMEVLTKKFPNEEIKINTKIHKQNNKIDNVTYFITIEPSSTTDEKEPKESSTTPKDETTTEVTSETTTQNVLTTPSEEEPIKVDFDLTKPSTNLVSDILTVIPNIEKEVDKKRPAKKPLNIEFQVKPSKNTNEKTLKKDMKDIMEVLTKKFPNEEIKINTKIHKQNNKIDNVTYFITIEPSSTTDEKEPKESSTTPKDETTTEVTSGTTTKNVLTTPSEEEPIKVDFDLTKPSTNLVSDILTVIPNIEKEVDKKRPAKKPLNIEFQVKPSKNTNEKTLKKDMKDIMEVLTKKFPNEEIKINTKIHKQNNKIDNVTYFITIEPSSTTDEKEPKESSTTPKDETTTEVTSETTTQNVLTTPSEEEPIKVDFDLTKPSTNLVSDILTVIPNIEKEVDKKRPAKKPLNIEFQVKPSKNTNEKTLKKDMKDIMEVLTKKFPNEEIKINTKIHKQNNKTDNVTYFITIEPSSTTDEKEPKESSTTPKDETTTEVTSETTTQNVLTTPSEEEPIKVDFDLTKPSTNLVSDILTVIPNIEKEVDKKRPAKKPLNIEFQVKPSKNTNEKTLKKDMKDIMEVLTKKFPNEEIKINTKIHKQNNKIDNVTYFITIEPSSTTDEKEPKESSTTPKDETTTEVTSETTTQNVLTTPSEEEPIKVDFDLTKPSTNLVSDILTVIPNIEKEVDNKRPTKKPVNIEFQVKPSKNTNEKTLKKDMNDIMEVLTKKFPNDEVKINTKIHKQNNKIDNVTYFITIEPSSTTATKEVLPFVIGVVTLKPTTENEINSEATTPSVLTTPSEEEPIKVDFDLTKPSTNLVSDILTVIPNIEKEVDNKRPTKKPVNIEFQVKPSKNTNEKTLKKDMKDIMEVLTKKFPNDEVKINTKIHKQNNKIDNVTYFITIEPSSTTDEKEPKESSTTPKEETKTEVTSETTTQNVLTTPSEEEPIKVDFDLTKPSTDLVSDILTIIPDIEKEVDNKRPAKKPVNIEFQVKPSKNTNEKTLKKDMKDIMEVLTKKFPNDEVKINTKIHKQNNKIDNVTYFITIEPSSTTDEKEPKESSTTPKDEMPDFDKSEKIVQEPSTTYPTSVKDLFKEYTTEHERPEQTLDDIDKSTTTPREEISVSFEDDTFKESTTAEKESTTGGTSGKVPETTLLTENTSEITETTQGEMHTETTTPSSLLTDIMNKFTTPGILKWITGSKETGEVTTTPATSEEGKTEMPTGENENIEKLSKTTTTPSTLDKILGKVTIPEGKKSSQTESSTQTEPSTTSSSALKNLLRNFTIPKWITDIPRPSTPKNIFDDFTISRDQVTTPKEGKVEQEITSQRETTTTSPRTNDKFFTVPDFISKWFTDKTKQTESSTVPKETGYELGTTTSKDETPFEETTAPVRVTTGRDKVINVGIDLSRPGTNFEDNIEGIIPNIAPTITSVLKESHPVTLTFEIKPPTGSDPSYIDVTTQSLLNILTKHFPNDKINIKTKAQKDPEGYVTQIVIQIVIEQSKPQKPEDNNVDIDISKPGSSLSDEVSYILPNILPKVTAALNNNNPATLTFTIKPPTQTTENDLQIMIEPLQEVIRKYFPENEVKIKLNANKNPQGYISQITVDLTIVPAPKDTTGDDDIDLTKPGTTLVTEFNKLFPNMLPNITKTLEDNKPISITFKVKPSTGMTESYLPVIISTLESILTQDFPRNKITVDVNAEKDTRNYLKEIIINIRIEPSPTEKGKNVIIDLGKPGTTLVNEVREVIPTILTDVTEKLSNKQPVTLNFKIRPPTGTTESYLQNIPSTLETILSQYFPNNKISFKISASKDPQGYITVIIVDITVDPSESRNPTEKKVDIDLTKPGRTLTDQINDQMPSIMNDITDQLKANRPTTLTFKIKPPRGSTESYLQELANSVVTILTSYFPDNEITVKLNAEKDSRGYISDVTLEITLKPSTTPAGDDKVDIDLTKPGTTLIKQIQEKMPNILGHITNKLKAQHPVTVTFKVKPPSGSTESYLQELTNSVTTILTKYFPNNKISLKMNADKNSRGYITEVTLEITINPSSIPQDDDVDIDLTKPGTTLIEQFKEKMPDIMKNVKESMKTKRPVTLSFNIKPPSGSTESYLDELTNSVMTIMSKYFPANEISIKVNTQKDPQGFITVVTLEITLQPSTAPESGDVDIDLSKPGVTLTNEIGKIMPSMLPHITKDLANNKPVTLSFKIKPPPRSTQNYLQQVSGTLQTLFGQYLPNNEISIKLNAQQNSQNYFTLLNIQITIQPSDSQIPQKRNIEIDLTNPNVDFYNELSGHLTAISSQVTSNLGSGKPVNITIGVKPPHRSTEDFIHKIIQPLESLLKKIFPSYKINIETSAEKNSQGYISDILFVIVIQPAEQPKGYSVDINLSNSRYTLMEQIYNIIPNILPTIQDDLSSGESITLSFKVLPPNRSGQGYLKTLTDSLVPILSKFFPENEMGIKTSAQKNSQGYLVNIIVDITIKSNVQLSKVDIDLSIPGSTLRREASNVLPQIAPHLKGDLKRGKPVTLRFNIRAPMNSGKSYQNQVTNELVSILPKYFPYNRMGVKTSSSMDAQGFISVIVVNISIQP